MNTKKPVVRLPQVLLTLLFTALLLSSISANAVQVIKDVPYLGPDREEKLDIYLPDESFERPIPAVLLIHGGGWRGGDKADPRERNIGNTLASHGYAVFSINYLLNGEVQDEDGNTRHIIAWPQNIYDCKSALRFIRAYAKDYGIDPNRIAVMGGSAGGHLSMLLGSTAHHEELNRHGLYTDQPNHVSAIITFYGNYDIRGRRVSRFAGSTPEETAANETLASPVTHIDANTPPMLIVHGTGDNAVPVKRSRLLAEHLKSLGLEYEYIEIPGAPHSFDLQPKERDLRPDVLAFLKKHL